MGVSAAKGGLDTSHLASCAAALLLPAAPRRRPLEVTISKSPDSIAFQAWQLSHAEQARTYIKQAVSVSHQGGHDALRRPLHVQGPTLSVVSLSTAGPNTFQSFKQLLLIAFENH